MGHFLNSGVDLNFKAMLEESQQWYPCRKVWKKKRLMPIGSLDEFSRNSILVQLITDTLVTVSVPDFQHS